MQSIALVLSQTDFCAALGHLGQPSLASAVPAWNHFKSPILCHLKQKKLQSSVFFCLFYLQTFDFDVFLSEKEKIQILPEITHARPIWTVLDEVLASEFHVFTVLTTQSSHRRGHVVVFYWFAKTKN